jgi:adenylate cyclase
MLADAVVTEERNEEAVRQELERVLASSGFARNERLSQFLRYVVHRHTEHRDGELKESLIAVEVFGRKPDYDPKLDSIVRTEAGRLRARLAEYYAAEGSGDPLIITLPKGGYIPQFQRAERLSHRRAAPSDRFWLTLAGLVAVLTFAGWWVVGPEGAAVRISVLPLENLSHDPDDDYLADGLTDETIRNLSIIDGLAVRSRTSSFALKGKHQSIRETGKLLEVDYILEGSVLRAGKQLRINVQLIRVRDDFPLWAGRYDREVTDILAVQDEIANSIVNNLRLKLGHGRRRYETSVEAYDFYLRGSALILRQGTQGAIKSIRPFEQAIAKDPSFAPAYAGLGAAYAIRSIQFPLDHPVDELSKMRAAADKAIGLDPLLAEAHEARALAYARDAQWEPAEQSFRRAIELDPNCSNSYVDFALWLLSVLGRNEEALDELRAAEKIDRLSPDVQFGLAQVLISLGRYAEAAEHCGKLPDEFRLKVQCAARAELGRGRIAEAIQMLVSDPTPNNRGFLGYAYARSGRQDDAEKLASIGPGQPNQQALIFAGLEDKDRTMEALSRMAALGAQRVGMYLGLPELATVRGDARMPAFRKKLGLPSNLPAKK